MNQMRTAAPSPVVDDVVFSRVAGFRPADPDDLDRIEAREIGFDFARRGLGLPADPGTAFREGWLEGRARFGQRFDGGTPWDRKLLRLRHSAWRRSRIVDKLVTAEHLERISVSVCPITREVLTTGTHGLSDATVDRVFNGGAYAVGNLAVMSQRANLAKANRSIEEIGAIAHGLDGEGRYEGLGRVEWVRLESLCSLSLPSGHVPHVCPLTVMPPKGLVISHGFAIVMIGTSLMAVNAIRPAVTAGVRELCGATGAKKAFDEYLKALRVRKAAVAKGSKSWQSVFHPLEDAWLSELVWEQIGRAHV